MDSGCSKHMIGDIKNFLSLKTIQGGGVSFCDGKKRYILGVGKVGKSLGESIGNEYHVNGLKYSLLSVSQIFDMGNEVKFTSEKSTVVSLTKKKVILTAFRSKNMYVANLEKDVVKPKEELEKSLKWTKSSNITPLFNPHSKYVFVSDNLLCLHCGKNGHLKNECVS